MSKMSKSKRLSQNQSKDDKSKKSDKEIAKKKKIKAIYTPVPGQGVDQGSANFDGSSENSDEENELESSGDESKKEEWERYWTMEQLQGKYKPIRHLGSGSYGVVYEGESLWENKHLGIEKGARVAIKQVRRVFQTDTDTKRLLRELKILHALRNHQCIVKLYDILPPVDCSNYKTLTLVFEFVDADLSKIFKTNQFFSSLHVQYMMYHLLLGINYMHSGNIIHRDLKPANVLINADCSIKVCDFGLARGFSEDDSLNKKDKKDKNEKKNKKPIKRGLTTHVVTRWYRAPEVILLQQKKKYLTAVDMWSAGCIFAELLQMIKENCPTAWKRGPLFPGDSCFPLSPKRSKNKKGVYQSHFDQIRVIFDVLGSPSQSEINKLNDEQARAYLEDLPTQQGQNIAEMFPGTDAHGIDLLMKLLKFNVQDRLDIKKALEHKYFTRVRDPDLEKIHAPAKFDFEGVTLKKAELGSLILRHILKYRPKEKERFKKSGAMIEVKTKKLNAK